MKRIAAWLMVIFMLTAFTGCGWFGSQDEKIAGKTAVPYTGRNMFLPHPEAEALLTEAFVMLEWEKEDWEAVVGSRTGIAYMFNYMETVRNVDGQIPYYVLRVGFDFVNWMWRTHLRPQLDGRSLDGSLGPNVSMNYYYVARDIDNNLRAVASMLQQTEKDIDAAATQADIDMVVNLYETIRPMIDFIK